MKSKEHLEKMWSAKRLPRDELRRIRELIADLKEQGLTYAEIATRMTEMGIKTGNGSNPSVSFINQQMMAYRRSQNQAPPRRKPANNELQLSILTDPSLSDKKKVELLMALLS